MYAVSRCPIYNGRNSEIWQPWVQNLCCLLLSQKKDRTWKESSLKRSEKTPKNIPTNQRFTLSYPSFSVFSCRIFLPKTPNRSQLPNTKDLCRSAERCSSHDATCAGIRWKSARVDPFLRNDPFPTSLGNQPEEGSWKKNWEFFSNEITAKKCSPKKVSVAKKIWTANLFKCAVLSFKQGGSPFSIQLPNHIPNNQKEKCHVFATPPKCLISECGHTVNQWVSLNINWAIHKSHHFGSQNGRTSLIVAIWGYGSTSNISVGAQTLQVRTIKSLTFYHICLFDRDPGSCFFFS